MLNRARIKAACRRSIFAGVAAAVLLTASAVNVVLSYISTDQLTYVIAGTVLLALSFLLLGFASWNLNRVTIDTRQIDAALRRADDELRRLFLSETPEMQRKIAAQLPYFQNYLPESPWAAGQGTPWREPHH